MKQSSQIIADKARDYIKTHKKELCEKFANLKDYPPISNPSAYFMAGSPGADKTEFSKSFIKELAGKEPERRIVRIDADVVRDFIPFYDMQLLLITKSLTIILLDPYIKIGK